MGSKEASAIIFPHSPVRKDPANHCICLYVFYWATMNAIYAMLQCLKERGILLPRSVQRMCLAISFSQLKTQVLRETLTGKGKV